MSRSILNFTNWADAMNKPKTTGLSQQKGHLERLAETAGFLDSREDPPSIGKRINGVEHFHYLMTMDGNYVILTYDDPNKVETARVFDFHQTKLFTQPVDVRSARPVYIGEEVEEYLKMKIICKRNIEGKKKL